MSDHNDNADKTEKPTAHHLAKARREGNILRSKELSSIIILLSAWGVFMILGGYLIEKIAHILTSSLSFDWPSVTDLNENGFELCRNLLLAGRALYPIAGIFFICALLAPLTVGGIHLTPKKIKLDLTKINIFKGLRRISSLSTCNEISKIILKTGLIFIATALFIYFSLDFFLQLARQPLNRALDSGLKIVSDYSLTIIICLIPIASYDVLQQARSYYKKLRMSKSDLKKEHKDNEGDPQIKGRIRQIQQSIAQRRMMLKIPKADVIINNPTHISVALVYKKNKSAPQVIAKGRGLLAFKIRTLGLQHNIPMLEAPVLARAIYKHCELEEMIPSQLYMAVAQVLSWVYSIKQWQYHGGLKPQQPSNIHVPSSMDYKIRE